MAEQPINQNEIENRVYIGPNKTGDNIDAKRVGNYVFDPNATTWSRALAPFINTTYDTVDMSNADGNDNYQTITFKYGGSSVLTLSLTYDANSNITSLARS